jgi:hypothetical protein
MSGGVLTLYLFGVTAILLSFLAFLLWKWRKP